MGDQVYILTNEPRGRHCFGIAANPHWGDWFAHVMDAAIKR